MSTAPPVDIIALGQAFEDSLKKPLTAEQAKMAASAAVSLIHVLFYEHDHVGRTEIEQHIAALGLPIPKTSANLAGLAYIGMLFPNLSHEMKLNLINLKPADL